MELLKPAHPSHESLSGFSSNGVLHAAGLALLPNIAEEGSSSNNTGNDNIMNTRGEVKVYVAVGKSVEKAESLLLWSFKHFGCTEICLLYVHQPSPLIPTLLGKLPASRANAEVLAAYRREEREQMKMIVENYLSICHKAKVIAGIISTDCDQVQKGIVELVNRHHVRKLVMWSEADTCMKVSKSSSKAHYVAKNAPLFCKIWFVNKGKHVWTRDASEITSPLPPGMISSSPRATATLWRTESSRSSKSKLPFYREFHRSSSAISIACSGISDWVQSESSCAETISPTISGAGNRYFHRSSVSQTSASISSENSSAKRRESSDSDENFDEESLNFSLEEMRMEAKASRNKAFEELLRRKKLEIEAMEAISKIKNFEFALAHEFKLIKEAEDAMRNAMQEQEKFFEEREEASRELNRTMRNVALLDSRAQEANRRCDEAAEELKVIQANNSSLRLEKQRIRQQKMEAVHWLERWRRHGESGAANCNDFLGFVEKLPELAEFPLSDLQTATCDFSESFKLGQGGYGCVYKGEMLGRTVAIKKLHARNMQGQSEFQKEVQVLGKLQHRHLVTLLGACPEAWSLVYEYLPNGSLHDRLFQKSNISPLTWKIRARIIAEISSALCFLHSSKPEKIVHGDLKPQNILLDSKLSCKICEFGICRLVAEDTFYCPSFRKNIEPMGAFPYTDPEVHRIGVLTPKSDIYSFGVIILQLLTGRSAVGLVGEVRRTMSCGNLASILDHSAGEWPMFVARRLADLGLQFSELSSRERPDLTPALVREVEQLHVSEERPVPSFFLCPIRQEIMHDPLVAADGFTYEGEAMRGWLEKGRETSPMTNLKLSHSHLTPNHALRLAIQDWLCRS